MGSLVVVAPRAAPPDPATAERALSAAPHRGPEFDVRVHDRTLLAVSNHPGWRDSWLAGDGTLLAAFSGCLDNRLELQAELSRRGIEVRGEDPASTLLALFAAERERAPDRLRGAFAAAVSDGRRVWCFRDHLGFRGLHYRVGDHGFVGASEGKQVVAGAGVPREPDVEAVGLAFWDRLDEERTVLKGVRRLPRASVGLVDAGAVSISRYWDPSSLLESERLSVDEAVERLDGVLEHTISRMVTGEDVLLLSGGIDSPAIAAYAAPAHRERSGRSLRTLSRRYPEYPEADEGAYIEQVGERLDLELHEYSSTVSGLDRVSYWVDLLDGPSNVFLVPDVAESYARARALGGRAVMTGELAEFVFTQNQHLIGHLIFRGRVGPTLRWLRQRRGRGQRWHSVGREVAASLAPAAVARHYAELKRRGRDMAPWLPADDGSYRYDLLIPARRRWTHFQLSPFFSPAVSFEAADIVAAVNGVHERKPLGDVDRWEFLLSLPAEIKFPDLIWKSLLRQALRGRLPDAVLDRREKAIFDQPVLALADYPGLERHILRSEHRIDGIDYESLRGRIERRDFKVLELIWAYDLARTHAFLNLWS